MLDDSVVEAFLRHPKKTIKGLGLKITLLYLWQHLGIIFATLVGTCALWIGLLALKLEAEVMTIIIIGVGGGVLPLAMIFVMTSRKESVVPLQEEVLPPKASELLRGSAIFWLGFGWVVAVAYELFNHSTFVLVVCSIGLAVVVFGRLMIFVAGKTKMAGREIMKELAKPQQ
jgi:hypothetical protein